MTLKLYPFQQDGANALANKSRYLIRSAPGLGKTAQLISPANKIAYDSTNILVICPKSMCITWKREIKKWKGIGRYTVINHDRLLTEDWEEIKESGDILILDESHLYIKNQATQRCIKVKELVKKAKVTWLSTATHLLHDKRYKLLRFWKVHPYS